jgi:outer membrane receptor protein involved in Fe transport
MKAVIKIIGVLIMLPGIVIHLSAQSIKGKVLNENGKPLSNVNVLLLHSKDSVLVKGMMSDTAGSYLFTDVPTGTYLLQFTFAGLQPVCSAPYFMNSMQDDIVIGETRMQQAGVQLKNVTVTAKKPLFEQKMDRLVVNVRNNVTAVGSTVLEVLERSPGVTVDRQNNIVSMGGKDGVVVMINGKESRMPVSAILQMLAGMTASTTERIELITTPPSNFSAEGNAGIINIVLIENNTTGTNGSFTSTVGTGRNKMVTSALNFNHRKGKINVYGDYSFSKNDLDQVFHFYRRIGFAGSTREADMITDRAPVTSTFNSRTGIDIQLTKKTMLGILASVNMNNWKMDAISTTFTSIDHQPDSLMTTDIDEKNNWKSLNGNLNFYHVFKKDETISFNLDYLYFKANNPVDYLNSFFSGSGNLVYDQQVRSRRINPIRFIVASGDYNRRIGKNTMLQAGAKFTFSGFTNDLVIDRMQQGGWVTDEDFSTSQELNESIQAAYISFNSTLNPKTTMQVGVRYEYTNSELGTQDHHIIVDRHYGKLFPTFFLSRKLTDHSTANFSYSRRITRPTFNELAPFTIFLEPNSFTTGNAALQPSIADIVTAGYSFKNYIFSLSYTYDAGSIARLQPKVDPATNKLVGFSENLKSLQTMALTVAIPISATKWWNMQYNVTGKLQRSQSMYIDIPIQINHRNIRIATTQSFKLPKNYTIEIAAFYQSADIQGRSIRKSFGTFDMGVQKKVGKKGKFSVTATDIFNTTYNRNSTNIPEQNLYLKRRVEFTSRMFKLTYTTSFGNTRLQAKRNRLDNSEEERNRVL